jgi:hypothetical protein
MQTVSPFYTLVQRSERDKVMEIQVMEIQVMEIQVTEIQVMEIQVTEIQVTEIQVMEIQVMEIQVMEIQVTEIQVPRSSQLAHNVTVCDVSKHDSASMFTVKQAGTK